MSKGEPMSKTSIDNENREDNEADLLNAACVHLDKLREEVYANADGMRKLVIILNGLREFAQIRDDEDAGDWVAVVQTADLVSRQIKDLADNLKEAADAGVPEY